MFRLFFRFSSCSGDFLKCNFKLEMPVSINALKKLSKEELLNTVLEYQNKFDSMLSNINT